MHRRITALETFDEDQFRAVQKGGFVDGTTNEFWQHLFKPEAPGLQLELQLSDGSWWEALGAGINISHSSGAASGNLPATLRQEHSSNAFDEHKLGSDDPAMDGDGSHSARKGKMSNQTIAKEETSDNDSTATASTASDLDAQVLKSQPIERSRSTSKPTSPTQAQGVSGPPRKIGALGGDRRACHDSTSPKSMIKDRFQKHEVLSSPQLASLSPQKPPRKLGRIGGSNRPYTPPEVSASKGDVFASEPQLQSLPSRDKGKQPQDRGRTEIGGRVETRETSRERADRNREKLKRELEEKEKAKTHGRKKRKF